MRISAQSGYSASIPVLCNSLTRLLCNSLTRRILCISASLFALFSALPANPSEAHPHSPASRPSLGSGCKAANGWIDVQTGHPLDRLELYRTLAEKHSVVLLGESHTNFDHHRWQLQTLAALHGRKEKIVIGFEVFPRRLQPVLDKWVAGKLSAQAFLKETDWRRTWGTDPDLYMPLFQFARLNGIPMIALNVERKLVSRVGASGWASIPVAEREGVSDPAPATPAYQRELAKVFHEKKTIPADKTNALQNSQKSKNAEVDEKTSDDVLQDPKFKRFVEAQLTWDRAMAQALADARQNHPGAMIVGIMGKGHIEYGHGVPQQLKDLDVPDTSTLVPVSTHSTCELVGTSYATAVFSLPTSLETASKPNHLRLGVFLEKRDGAARIIRILPGSVAQTIGLKVGDHVTSAAGVAIKDATDLVDIVGRQAPGTWLPLTVRRGKKRIELIAKFPPPADRDS